MKTDWVEVFRLLGEMEKCAQRIESLCRQIGYGEG